MRDRFALRFAVAAGRPRFDEVRPLWEAPLEVRRDEDGVLTLAIDGAPVATVDLLPAEDPRGRAVLSGLRDRLPSDDEAADGVRFVLEGATAVVVARPLPGPDGQAEAGLAALDRLWDHLFEAHGGVLQVDGEGFLDEDGPVVEVG